MLPWISLFVRTQFHKGKILVLIIGDNHVKNIISIFLSVSTVCKEIRQHMQFKSEDVTEAHKLK